MNRQDLASSSFDLFLDTICNAFGGVVFLAILLAILIQTRAIVQSPEQRNESPLTSEQVRELTEQLDTANADYAGVVAALGSLPSAQQSSDDEEYRRLTQANIEAEENLTVTVEEQTQKAELLARQLAQNAEIAEENALTPQQLKKVDIDVRESTASLETLLASRQTTLRLPRDHASNAASALVMLKGSRVYLAKTPNTLPRAFNDEHVSTQSDAGGGVTVKPRTGRGWTLNDDEVLAIIENARSQGHVVTIAVWPESYGEFSTLKKALIQNQVPYQLWPQQHGEDLTVFFGGGHTRVQ